MEIEDKLVSDLGTASFATVVTPATDQYSYGIAGNVSCDTSATVATVEPIIFPNDESESLILCLKRQMESIWRPHTLEF